ncbi:MAG: four helix bundle protein [Ardenticatenales bacterium]|nr:four helix bundle protein [Ardenticatenales bacterium]
MSEPRTSLTEALRERTKQYALRIIRLYGSLPATTEADVIGRQLLRSGTSIGANYREAYRARSAGEYVAKLGICLQELDESGYWLELLADAGIFSPDKLAPLQDETNQLIALLTTIVKKRKKERYEV